MLTKKTSATLKSAYPEIWQAQIPEPWEKWAKGTIISAAILLLIAAVWSGVITKIFRFVPNVRLRESLGMGLGGLRDDPLCCPGVEDLSLVELPPHASN